MGSLSFRACAFTRCRRARCSLLELDSLDMRGYPLYRFAFSMTHQWWGQRIPCTLRRLCFLVLVFVQYECVPNRTTYYFDDSNYFFEAHNERDDCILLKSDFIWLCSISWERANRSSWFYDRPFSFSKIVPKATACDHALLNLKVDRPNNEIYLVKPVEFFQH